MVEINKYQCFMVAEPTEIYCESAAVKTPADSFNLIRNVAHLDQAPQEQLWVVMLTTKQEVCGITMISQGSLHASASDPRDVFRAAMLSNAYGIILFHNHPSGNPEPSKDDIDVTERLRKAGEILGIHLFDHIIVGSKGFVSFKERNLL